MTLIPSIVYKSTKYTNVYVFIGARATRRWGVGGLPVVEAEAAPETAYVVRGAGVEEVAGASVEEEAGEGKRLTHKQWWQMNCLENRLVVTKRPCRSIRLDFQ